MKVSLNHQQNEKAGIPGWLSGLAPAFGPGHNPGVPGSSPTSGPGMEPASPSSSVSASLKKLGKTQIHKLTLHLKELEKEQ